MTENIRLAIHAIYQHRLRSLLTMLGIIVDCFHHFHCEYHQRKY